MAASARRELIGTRSTEDDRGNIMLQSVYVHPGGEIPFSEGFCPNHQRTPLNRNGWCSACGTYWHMWSRRVEEPCSAQSSPESSASPGSSSPSTSKTASSSACDEAGICQYDRTCEFYASNCRHTEPKP